MRQRESDVADVMCCPRKHYHYLINRIKNKGDLIVEYVEHTNGIVTNSQVSSL